MPKTLTQEDLVASAGALSGEELTNIDRYWRAANYLSVGQIYLYDNPLLKKPLTLAHVKPRMMMHAGEEPSARQGVEHRCAVSARNVHSFAALSVRIPFDGDSMCGIL